MMKNAPNWKSTMHILFLSPEVWPFIHVSGLSEVSHDLPLALGALGHQVSVITLKGRLTPEVETGLEKLDALVQVPISYTMHAAGVYRHRMGPGVEVYLIEHESFFDRDGLYGNEFGDYQDNAERFIFFSRACLELALAMDWRPDVIHANDWTTGLTPLYLKTLYADRPHFKAAASLMTVHNLGKQGVFWHYDMPLTGLGWECFVPEMVEFYGKINFLKAGLVSADKLSTVSPRYAREILGADLGLGLEGVLNFRRDDLAAIQSGIDYAAWDPTSDRHLARNYDHHDLEGRRACQDDLRAAFGLDRLARRPIVAVVGALVERKGLDLICESIDAIVGLGLDLLVTGTGSDQYHEILDAASQRLPGRLGLKLGYDLALAHKVMAGADMVLMPSRYEPCGLHQMHAMRYGAVPVARATGGLDDTVDEGQPPSEGTGFKFEPYSAEAMLEALGRALAAHGDPDVWRRIMQNGMGRDFSWRAAATRYDDLYRQAIAKRRGARGA